MSSTPFRADSLTEVPRPVAPAVVVDLMHRLPRQRRPLPSEGPEVRAPRTGGWVAGYRRRLMVTDAVIVVGVVGLSQIIRFSTANHVAVSWSGGLGYWTVSTVLAVAWLLTLALHGAWDAKTLGAGPAEFRRVTVATCAVISCTAIFSYVTHLSIARGYVAIAFPLGLFGLMGGRWVWRMLLAEHRRAGTHLNSVLVIGGGVSAPGLANRLRSTPEAGYRVAGLCLPGGAYDPDSESALIVDGFPVLGGMNDVLQALRGCGADTVAVAASEVFGAESIRQLAWQLEGTSIQLILAPALTDVAGPRIHVEPVAGLPLMDVRSPSFRGPKLLLKIALDYLVAGVGALLLSPVYLLTALAILVTSGRPVFYRPPLIGKGGRLFRLFRFRSVADGRVTRVGKVIRRLGIDQSAQLLNVLAGHLSIVGTRPIDPDELVDENTHLERRTRLRPGMTGPAQVLGRSRLSAADQMQLDLRYLENWSISRDLLTMWQAIGALLHRRWTQPPSPGSTGQSSPS